jgi:hypothetical protein
MPAEIAVPAATADMSKYKPSMTYVAADAMTLPLRTPIAGSVRRLRCRPASSRIPNYPFGTIERPRVRRIGRPNAIGDQLRRSVQAIERSLQYRRSNEPIDDHLFPESLKKM